MTSAKLTRYKIGDHIQAKVIEHIDGKEWILSLEGNLIRVVNSSRTKFKEGEKVWLKIESLEPPRLVEII